MFEAIVIGMIFFLKDGEVQSETSRVIYTSVQECELRHEALEDWLRINFPVYLGYACIKEEFA